MYRKRIKRIIDFTFSLIGLILLSPLFILLIIYLYFANKGAGVFFTQKRPGKNEKIFSVIKFKTMTDKRDKEGNLLPEMERITKTGKLIRASSLDEIPQLINVLKGDMSLIGPRPLLVQYIPLYSKQQARRHEVRPGITGWAQVNGRNTITWIKKFEYDIEYVDNLSFLLDLKILFLTFYKVIKRSDVNLSESLTAEKYNGKN